MSASQFELSIEPLNGETYRYGFHLGTIESVARYCAEERFHGSRVVQQSRKRGRAIGHD